MSLCALGEQFSKRNSLSTSQCFDCILPTFNTLFLNRIASSIRVKTSKGKAPIYEQKDDCSQMCPFQ